MNIRRSWAIAYRYFLIVSGNVSRTFQIFVWGGIDIVLWGFVTKYLDSLGGATFSFTTVLLGAVVLWELVTRAQQGISSPFLEDVWSHNLLNMFASPISIQEYLLGLVFASIVTSGIGFTILLTFASFIFGFSLWSVGLPALAFLMMLFVFGTSLGVIAISFLLRFGPSAEWFVWPIPALIAPFAGVFYPVSVLPLWMQTVSGLIPASYVFENLRSIVTTGSFSVHDLLVGTALDLFFFAIVCGLFIRIYARAIQTGAIARYSAES